MSGEIRAPGGGSQAAQHTGPAGLSTVARDATARPGGRLGCEGGPRPACEEAPAGQAITPGPSTVSRRSKAPGEGEPVLDAGKPALDGRGELARVAGGEVAQAAFMCGLAFLCA